MSDPERIFIPPPLPDYKQFVLWREEIRDGRVTKVPRQPGGSHSNTKDSSTWVSLGQARSALRQGSYDGRGFVFTKEDPFVGIDLDDCFEDGKLSPEAKKIIEEINSYTEVSPSGTGVHIIAKGDFPESGRRTSDVEGLKEIEVYRERRYFTMTGDHLEGTPREVKERSEELKRFYTKYFAAEAPTGTSPSSASNPPDLPDEKVLKKAREAKNGEKFRRLYSGDTSGYPSQSEADMALAGMLAFWTDDPDQIDRLFRRSGLYRKKWEREDYRDRTIEKVLRGKTEFFDPGGERQTTGEESKSAPSQKQPDQEQTGSTRPFWRVQGGKVKLDRRRFLQFLHERGIGKFYGESEHRSTLVRVENKVVRRISSEKVKDFVLGYVRGLDASVIEEDCTPGEIEEMLLRGGNVYFSDALLEGLRPLDLDTKEDTAEESYFFFRNGYVRVTAEGYELLPYSQMDGVIWEDQIIERDFVDLQGTDGHETWEWHQHLHYVSGQDPERHNALCTGIGYLLHGWKDPSKTKAVIFMDEEDADFEEGRSGKSLTARALQEMVPTVRIDGRNFRFRSQFAFQRVREDTQVVDFNDVRPKFPFERLFSLITGEMPVERKGRDEFTIPFEQSPKFLLSTNYVVEGGGASFEDRTFQIEFAPYYSPDWTPVDEFGHRFFEDWGEEEWAQFDNIMLACVRQYLRDGLVEYEHVNLRRRKLRQETHSDFAEWITGFIDLGRRYDKKALWRSFKEAYEPDHDHRTSYQTTQWVKIFAQIYDYSVEESKSGSARYIKLCETE